MNPAMNLAVAAKAGARLGPTSATAEVPAEHPLTWRIADVPRAQSTDLLINKSGYKTAVDAASSDASIVAAKILPRRTADDDLRDRERVKAWRQDEERGLRAWPRIRRRLSMLGLVLAGDAMILGAVLLLIGVAKF